MNPTTPTEIPTAVPMGKAFISNENIKIKISRRFIFVIKKLTSLDNEIQIVSVYFNTLTIDCSKNYTKSKKQYIYLILKWNVNINTSSECSF